MIQRHSSAAIFLHWFNAVCWLFLLFTGFAILAGPFQPIGQWWHNFWHRLLGGQGLLLAHIGVGSLWAGVYAVMAIVCWRTVTMPFLRQVFRFSPKSDALWCAKKALWLTAGPKRMAALGIDPALPPQGFYNAGQRLVAVLAVISSIIIAVSGLFLAFASSGAPWPLSPVILQWLLLLHFGFAALMGIFLPIHIYMAALAPGEGPALRSMFTGHVPSEFAKHHNPLWQVSQEQNQSFSG